MHEPAGTRVVAAKLLQNRHFLYGSSSHNSSVWQQRAENISRSIHCETSCKNLYWH